MSIHFGRDNSIDGQVYFDATTVVAGLIKSKKQDKFCVRLNAYSCWKLSPEFSPVSQYEFWQAIFKQLNDRADEIVFEAIKSGLVHLKKPEVLRLIPQIGWDPYKFKDFSMKVESLTVEVITNGVGVPTGGYHFVFGLGEVINE